MKRRFSKQNEFGRETREFYTETMEQTFEKEFERARKEAKSKTKKITQDEIDYETFEIVDLKLNVFEMLWKDVEPVFNFPVRNNRSDMEIVKQLFFALMPLEFLDQLVDTATDLFDDLPKILYKGPTVRYDFLTASADCVDIPRRLLLLNEESWCCRTTSPVFTSV
jgi:hypothetical protein